MSRWVMEVEVRGIDLSDSVSLVSTAGSLQGQVDPSDLEEKWKTVKVVNI